MLVRFAGNGATDRSTGIAPPADSALTASEAARRFRSSTPMGSLLGYLFRVGTGKFAVRHKGRDG